MVKEIVECFDGYIVIVMKLIVLVGIGWEVENIIWEINLLVDFIVVLNFEFFCEGVVIEDFKWFDWVVVGIDDECVWGVMCEFYCLFYFNEILVFFMVWEIFELIKYVVNVFFVIKIMFINEMVNLCEKVGVNV